MRFLLALFVLTTVKLIAAEPDTINFKPFDFSVYDADPLKQLNDCWQSSKKKFSVLGTCREGASYLNVMDVREITNEGIAFLSNELSEKVSHLKAKPEAMIIVSWDLGDGRRPKVAKVQGTVDFSYKHPQAGMREVIINGEKQQMNWVSYRLVPTKVTFAEYIYPDAKYTLVQFLTYSKQDGNWVKTVNPKPYVILTP